MSHHPYPYDMTEEEKAAMQKWRVYDTGTGYACQTKGWFVWRTQKEWCGIGFGSYVKMIYNTPAAAWNSIKWMVHNQEQDKKDAAKRAAYAKQRATTRGRVYTTPEGK